MYRLPVVLALLFVAASAGAQPPPAVALDQLNPGDAFELPACRTYQDSALDARYLAGRVAVVTFWYRGCQPCMAEVPVLNRLYDRFRARGLRVVAIAPHPCKSLAEYQDSTNALSRELRQATHSEVIRYPLVAGCTAITHPDTEGSWRVNCDVLLDRFRLRGYPLTFFIGRDGRIAQVKDGFVGPGADTRYIEEEYARELDALLAK